jgi:3-oxoacyl-[acyl-carrier protein] reductase
MSDGAGVALVTGPSRGIGRATAEALARRGLSLCLVGRQSAELEATRQSCSETGAPSVSVVLADLSDLTDVERAARELDLAGCAPELLVHVAGVVRREPVESVSLESWQEQLAVNLTAPFLLTRALLPRMRARGRGRILFVGSISSTLGSARQSAYCASKWGLVGFMKSLAEELSDSGLMTAAVLPGSVDTRMLEGSGFPKRMSAEDVARTLVFLALDAPLSHNGAAIEMFGV